MKSYRIVYSFSQWEGRMKSYRIVYSFSVGRENEVLQDRDIHSQLEENEVL